MGSYQHHFSSGLENSPSVGLPTSGCLLVREVSFLKRIPYHAILLHETCHVLLTCQKTFWWLIRLSVHRPLLTSNIWFLFSPPPHALPSRHVPTMLNFPGFHESVMPPLNTILSHVPFPLPRTLKHLPLPPAPDPLL